MTKRRIQIALAFVALFLFQCNLFGPEPGDPVFPAKIDPGDSVAIRAILDFNNLQKIQVRQVIGEFEIDRIHYLYLDSLGLDSFAFTKDFNKLDSLTYIDLSANKITNIGVVDSVSFKQLYTLILDNNLLTFFPLDLFKITGISTIYIEYNKISSIPQQLMASGFKRVILDHNQICSVTDSSVVAWLDSIYGVSWKSRQDCP
jgi:Leucine-rich repeat (LRR) protein